MWRRSGRSCAPRQRRQVDRRAVLGREADLARGRRRARAGCSATTVVLPQPLSPTSASVSPRAMWKLTPSTARTWPDLALQQPAPDREVLASGRSTSSDGHAVPPHAVAARDVKQLAPVAGSGGTGSAAPRVSQRPGDELRAARMERAAGRPVARDAAPRRRSSPAARAASLGCSGPSAAAPGCRGAAAL